ncbi:ion channel [Jeotgalibacillus haloalkalitolerans]|uniref:Ion channel n=1 Tax=Jeotgalibacillus haloalkalitolerans TaxID=3104292 RepID=A0ABU5KQY6_9BACL|nr:ion channel [Jeotgalibacillus sp. HH7-29]MDZ5713366.1 ion channel [Jeotgalibacillus sp. HH7-29]
MGWLLVIATTCIMVFSVNSLLKLPWEGYIFSLRNFVYLSLTYTVLLIGFAVIYTVMLIEGIKAVEPVNTYSFLDLFMTMLYFSAMMLFSVGNGEMIPEGTGRAVAVAAAFIGQVLPVTVIWTLIAKSDSQTFDK